MALAFSIPTFLAATFLVPAAHAQEVQTFRFANGLQAHLIADHRASVAVHMAWYKAGAMDEPDNKTGIAHMLEHLMFKGTDNLPAGEFSKKVSRLGGQDNAFTSRDTTAYFQKIARHNLPEVMTMEADRMVNLNLTDKEFLPEKDVVAEERRMRVDSNPTSRFWEKLMLTHYRTGENEHPYAHPIIGHADHIENYELIDAQTWYNTYYAPHNADVILVGDITPENAQELLTDTYATLENPVPSKDVPTFKRPTPKAMDLWDESKEFTFSPKDGRVPLFYRMYRTGGLFAGLAGQDANEQQAYATAILSHILGGSKSSRLYQSVVMDKRLADSAGSSYDIISRLESTFDVYAQPKQGVSLETIQEAIEAEITKLQENGVTDAELTRAKTAFKADYIYAQDDLMGMARALGFWLSAGGAPEDFDNWVQAIDKVSAADVQAAAKDVLQKRQSTTGYLQVKGY